MGRYKHHANVSPKQYPAAYQQGLQQAADSLQAYHYLRAAATQAYDEVPYSEGSSRTNFSFDKYTDHQLEPLVYLKIHLPSTPDELEFYVNGFRAVWENREGGILCCVANERPFWNLISNYHHSPDKTTGIAAWDAILDQLKVGAGPEVVPCMVRIGSSSIEYQ